MVTQSKGLYHIEGKQSLNMQYSIYSETIPEEILRDFLDTSLITNCVRTKGLKGKVQTYWHDL